MIKHFAGVTALASIALSSGAMAAGKEDVSTQIAKEQPAPVANDKTRYCINTGVVTGSIVQGRQCKTLKQWRAEGVDPTRKLSN